MNFIKIVGITGLFILFSVAAGAVDLEELQEELTASGASWSAGENQFTGMSDAELRSWLGAPLPPEAQIRETLRPSRKMAHRDPPAYYTWCDIDGTDWMTDVKNQDGCGACAAFSACGSVEALVRITRDDPTWPIDLSEQHLFSCANGDCPTGLYMGDAFDYFTANGVPDDDCLLYTAVDDNCSDSCEDWQDRVVKLDGWDLLWQYNVDVEALKSHVEQQPVSCYLEVFDDFYAYSDGVYECHSENLLGGHFVVIVGWDDAKDCWICKNSWGAGWGENGYFRIKRGEVEIGSWAMLPFYTVPPTPTPTPPPTATPEATPTPEPETGIALELPQTMFHPGDTFQLDATLTNTGTPVSPAALWVILDVFGNYWFYPTWVQYPETAFAWTDLATGTAQKSIIAPLTWPDIPGNVSGLKFWGAILNPDMQTVIGNIDSVEWGYARE